MGYKLVRVVWPGTGLHVLSEHPNKYRVVNKVQIECQLSKLIPLVAHQCSAERVAKQLGPLLPHHEVEGVVVLHHVRTSPALRCLIKMGKY